METQTEVKRRSMGKLCLMEKTDDGKWAEAKVQPDETIRTKVDVRRFVRREYADGGEFMIVRKVATLKLAIQRKFKFVEEPL